MISLERETSYLEIIIIRTLIFRNNNLIDHLKISSRLKNVKTILLIDDDDDDRWLFAEALARTVPSIQCDTTCDCLEALARLRDPSKSLPDIIFLDLNIPGMDGKKCLEQLKRDPVLKNIPVIVYSTSNFHRDISETEALGALEFIVKPSDYTSLCQMFRTRFGT